MSWIYVIVGILCLVALQFLRGALSMTFPTYAARPIQRPDEASFGGLDLIDRKTEQLAALGFAGPAWVGADPGVAEASGVNAHAVFRNADTGVIAWVGPTIELAHPNSPLTYYTSLLSDGRFAVTQVSDPYFAAVDDPKTPSQTIEGSDEATEIEAHKAFVASLDVPVARSSPQQDVIGFDHAQVAALLMQNWNLPDSHVAIIKNHLELDPDADFLLETSIVHISALIGNAFAESRPLDEVLVKADNKAWDLTGLDTGHCEAIDRVVAEQLSGVVNLLFPKMQCAAL